MCMKKFTLVLTCFLIVGCTAEPQDADTTEFDAANMPPHLLVPYMEEVLLQMRDDYRNAVSLHDAIRTSPAYGRQYALIEKYIEFLLPTIGQVETYLAAAKADTLLPEQYRTYTVLVSEWREKSTTVFGAVGRTL